MISVFLMIFDFSVNSVDRKKIENKRLMVCMIVLMTVLELYFHTWKLIIMNTVV